MSGWESLKITEYLPVFILVGVLTVFAQFDFFEEYQSKELVVQVNFASDGFLVTFNWNFYILTGAESGRELNEIIYLTR